MPTVPRYQPQVAQAPLPGVRADPNAEAGAFTTAPPVDLSGVARVAQQLAEDEVQRNNGMVVNAAERQLGDLRTSLMFDPETGAIAKRGHAALGAIDDVKQRWQEGVTKIRSSFKLTPDQERAVAQREQGYWATLNESVQSHTSAELKKQDIEDTADLLKQGLDDVSHDPAKADGNVAIAKARIADFAQRNGWSPIELAQKTAMHVSDLHAAAISRLVAMGTPESAKQASDYLTAHRTEFVGGQLDDAEKLVDEGVAQGEGLRQADAILGLGPTTTVLPDTTQAKAMAATGQSDAAPEGRATSMVDALARAERITDPKQRKAATDAIVSHFTHLEMAKRLEREGAAERVMRQMEASGGRLNRASPDYQLLVGHPEQDHVLHRQEQLLHPKDPGDPEAFMQALSLASLPSGRGEFLGMNFTGKDGQGLSTAQKTHLINLQRQISGTAATKDLAAAQADAAHWRRVAETESLKGANADADKITEALRLQHVAETKAQRLQKAPIADESTIPYHDFSAGDVDLHHPLAGVLSPVPRRPATPQQIDDAAKSPAYATYLDTIGVVLPKVAKPKAAP